MHSRRKGKSRSHKPPVKAAPAWLGKDKKEIESLVVSLAREGKAASEIGRLLRDEHGVPSVAAATNKRVNEILDEHKLRPGFPEDFMSLIRKAVMLRKHLERNPNDLHNRRGLELIEAKIHRLQKYYKRAERLPADWFYEPEQAALLVK
jgi:small subunit ribosomal protein S15